jgi:hypothetical protein
MQSASSPLLANRKLSLAVVPCPRVESMMNEPPSARIRS